MPHHWLGQETILRARHGAEMPAISTPQKGGRQMRCTSDADLMVGCSNNCVGAILFNRLRAFAWQASLPG
jgi:hypothetical protein